MMRLACVATIVLACVTAGCASRRAVPRPFPAPTPPAAAREEASPELLPVVATALTLRGIPYRNGGTDPQGFDCSGFVRYVFAQHGRALPREVQEQYRLGAPVDRAQVRPGDLVFFQTVSRGASHVGIALGGNEFVHAPSSRGVVRVERYTIDYWASRWVGARRIG
jgi:cell wall-associated NlpC family hydrolase